MSISHTALIALLASVVSLQSRGAAWSQNVNDMNENPVAADLVVQGHVLQESAEAIPQNNPNLVELSALWTYRIHIVHVIMGEERSEEITAKNTADPAIRRNIDFIFYLTRTSDGTYQVRKLERADR